MSQLSSVHLLPHEELSTFDPEIFPLHHAAEKRIAKEAFFQAYVDVRKLAFIASGLGDKGLTQF